LKKHKLEFFKLVVINIPINLKKLAYATESYQEFI